MYHYNPWTHTAQGACSSFDLFRRDPVNFFLTRFTGMTKPVAEVLANKVFCIFDDPADDSRRMSATEFGSWVKNLPTLLGGHGMQRTMSNSSIQGHRLSLSAPISHRPSSRQSSFSTPVRTPAIPTRSLSRAPSLEPAFEREELSTVIDNEDDVLDEDIPSRSASTTKRRKRGARKGKSAGVENSTTDETLVTLAVASQSLAREISKASKSSSLASASTKTTSSTNRRNRKPFEPVSLYAVPTALLKTRPPMPPIATPASVPPPPPSAPAPVTKKPSKWKLSFGKNSASTLASAAASVSAGRVSPVEEASPPASIDFTHAQPMSATASNVTSLIMGLDAPPNPRFHAAGSAIPLNAAENASSTWTRGRRGRESQESLHAHQPRTPAFVLSTSPVPVLPQDSWGGYVDKRATSPNSTRSSIRPCATVGSSASSVISSNWRSSMSSTATTSSAGTSTSAFTRYSNSSARSVSTTATSVSSTSWRTNVKPASTTSSTYSQGNIPRNIKSES